MLRTGQQIEIDVERPASGGAMIARHEGQVVLVTGAIPGERVTATVHKVQPRVAFASVSTVVQAAPSRRATAGDPLCGGCLYAHIDPDAQRALKAEIVADAFARIARAPLATPVTVAASPERGYRMRARLHVRGDRLGFYREGTHELCDPAATGQLLAESLDAASTVFDALRQAGVQPLSFEISENIPADQRGVSVELPAMQRVPRETLEALLGPALSSISAVLPGGQRIVAGAATISDTLATITSGRAAGELVRTVESFFQSNRYLVPDLVSTVLDAVLAEGGVLDLYAGVGLFSMALAGSGREGIVAVEGNPISGGDLVTNARAHAPRVSAVVQSVERHVAAQRAWPPTVIVDPPRTGLGKPVLTAITAGVPGRLVYVSCDPPTLARDARGLLDAGYTLHSIRAFDLFPNTPHVEAVAVFER